MTARKHMDTRVLLLVAALCSAGVAMPASISNASLGAAGVTTAIVPDAPELNQTAKVFLAAKYQGDWYVRGAGLRDWRLLPAGAALTVSFQTVLSASTPINITDLNLGAYPGLTLYVGYTTTGTTLDSPGHMKAIYTVPVANTGSNATPGLLASVSNGEGASATFTTAGSIDTRNPFFKAFGNGRACASCHDQNAGWSITPDTLAQRFTASDGLDPAFRTVDGANSPNAPVATLAQRFSAYSMLRTKGVIRVGLPMPAGAEFELAAVDDPYGYASAKELSLFRRPLPTTNLQFATAVMWDGRETISATGGNLCVTGSTPLRCYAPVDNGLLQQANDAVTGHAQFAAGLTTTERQQIVDFEKTLFTTQVLDTAAGSLSEGGALSGPAALARTPFYFGINDVASGDYRTGAAFNRGAMNLFSAWLTLAPPPGAPARPGAPAPDAQAQARAAIARGEQLFNNRRFTIAGVRGFNDDIGQARLQGTCTSCHSTPNVGTHSVPRFMDTGVSTAARRTPDLPLYTLRNLTTRETFVTTDPGRALITGKWADLGKMKVPSLRGIESRSPYFHNGSEDDIAQLIRFYDRRFQIGLSANEIADMEAFLKAL